MAATSSISLSTVLERGLRFDAEFHLSSHWPLIDRLTRLPNAEPLASLASSITSGHTPSGHDLSKGDVDFITVECIDEVRLNRVLFKHVEARHASTELARVLVEPGDVLVTIKRRISKAVPISSDMRLHAVINQDVARIRPQAGWQAGYLAAFLCCRFGQAQATTFQTEQMNPYLSIPNLSIIEVPRLPEDVQRQISDAAESVDRAYMDQATLYKEAENELLERLQWNESKFADVSLHFGRRLSAIMREGRADAEFHMPRYARLSRHLRMMGAMQLREFARELHRGVQPVWDDTGEAKVVSSGDLGPTRLDLSRAGHVSRTFFESQDAEKGRTKQCDVLVYSIGAYVGRANIYVESDQVLSSNHITIIRTDPSVCNPAYLSLFLNSPAGLLQSIRYASGSAQRELYPGDIAQFWIFLPGDATGKIDLEWQEKLARKVLAAASNEAEQRQIRVRQLVESAVVKVLGN
jgi:hypothetical protein